MKGMLTLAALAAFALAGPAADKPLAWPQFRGPNATGVADDQKPPVDFGPDKNVKWKVPALPGLSSPIVVGDLLAFTAFADGKLYTVAHKRADGKEAWRTEAPAKAIEKYFQGEGSPAASTPATDGERIVSYFGSCGVFCYDLAGKEVWKHELPTAQTMADFGRSWPTGWSSWSATSATTPRSSPWTRPPGRSGGRRRGSPTSPTAPRP